MVPLNSALEEHVKTYLLSENIPNVDGRIDRYFGTGSVALPCLFVTCPQKGAVVGALQGGIYRVPLQLDVVYSAKQVYDYPTAIDTLTNDVEEAMAGAQTAINGTVSGSIFIFDLTMKNAPGPEVKENTFHYVLEFEAVCKKRN
jgi:hypothetical protein